MYRRTRLSRDATTRYTRWKYNYELKREDIPFCRCFLDSASTKFTIAVLYLNPQWISWFSWRWNNTNTYSNGGTYFVYNLKLDFNLSKTIFSIVVVELNQISIVIHRDPSWLLNLTRYIDTISGPSGKYCLTSHRRSTVCKYNFTRELANRSCHSITNNHKG